MVRPGRVSTSALNQSVRHESDVASSLRHGVPSLPFMQHRRDTVPHESVAGAPVVTVYLPSFEANIGPCVHRASRVLPIVFSSNTLGI